MRRRFFPRWSDRRWIVGQALVILAALTLLGSGLSALQRPNESLAQEPIRLTPAPIDGQRAYGYLKKICDLGPRISGTEANTRERRMVADHFNELGGKVEEQHFDARHPLTGRRVHMVNLIGAWHPERKRRVLLCAHSDTRPRADQEEDPERLNQPFIGANDCASGVALLMEIAHHLDKLETPWGVDLVLLDGEELVYGNNPRRGEYFLGSTHFAKEYARQRRLGGARPAYVAGILFDMVGGKDLALRPDQTSLHYARQVVNEVWAVARHLRARSFLNERGPDVMDDHLPLNEIGKIKTIDLIEFPWRYWHTIDDVPENCSAESLAEVGRVVTAWLALPRKRGRR